MNNFFKKLWCG